MFADVLIFTHTPTSAECDGLDHNEFRSSFKSHSWLERLLFSNFIDVGIV